MIEKIVPGLAARVPYNITVWLDNIAQSARDIKRDGFHDVAGHIARGDLMFVIAVEHVMTQHEDGPELEFNVLVMSKNTIGWMVSWSEEDLRSYFRFPLGAS